MGDNTLSIGQSSLLPPGWTSHISPAGRTYYHNASSGVSTYDLPKPKQPKREKPVSKTLISNTSGWLKVTTNKGNVFYFHPESKTSQWLPPPQFDASKRARADDDDDEEDEEEYESEAAEDEEPSTSRDNGNGATGEAPDPEGVQKNTADVADPNDDDDDDQEWQRQMAEQMAAEAEAEATAHMTQPTEGQASDEGTSTQPPPPEATLEDQKRAFTDLLTSLNGTPQEINPMAPWDLEQSKFSHHPSFLALPTREREDTFNEWCKLRIREKRAAKAAASTTTKPSTSNPSRTDPFSSTSHSALLSLLRTEVRSTRTKYADFKSTFSRDPRFTSYGRSDSDREKLFKQHLVELGEEKRAAAQRAEADFLQLLSDRLPGNYRGKVVAASGSKEGLMEVWMEAKRGLVEDRRYDAVGSSTRRSELFGVWARGERRGPAGDSSSARSNSAAVGPDTAEARAKEKEAARAKALREREEKLLLDAIHTPHTSYTSAVTQLSRDPRFDSPALTDTDKQQLFHEHQSRLSNQQDSRIGSVFARYARSLDTHRDDVLARTLQDDQLSHPPLSVFAEDRKKLEEAYDRWDAVRKSEAEKAFKEMLGESAFVEFWGRLKKQASSAPEQRTQKQEEDEEGEGTTLVEMAKKVDLDEIESVLRNDA
ncbi:hypothetical protein, partial [Sporisorium scitamineum]